jgi:hypothetical protein
MTAFYGRSNRMRMFAMREEARSAADPAVRFRVIEEGTRARNRGRRPVAGRADGMAMLGELRDKPEGEFTVSQKRLYGVLCREERARHGLTDGLRLDRGEFRDYLERRRAEDARARGWG